ncbi:hypothetical protein [Ligaoa zhengdingensis]|jgi:hypothetical protein|nr:MAG TPA: hypothetical protein [Caudoviricetes sp.]
MGSDISEDEVLYWDDEWLTLWDLSQEEREKIFKKQMEDMMKPNKTAEQ